MLTKLPGCLSRLALPLRAARWAAISALLALSLMTAPPAQAQVSVLTYHNDNARTGQNLNETILKPSNVNLSQFGKLFTHKVDGYIYAQPLYVPNVNIPGKGKHNVVYVATEHDSIYAFDADNNVAFNAGALWFRTFINPISTIVPVPSADTLSEDIVPEIGITGTPVIDGASKTMYLVAKTREFGQYIQRLHAIDITNGAERLGSPVLINASVPGTGDGDDGTGNIPFDTLKENQRPGLVLSNGVVYISWASHGDNGPYHGWVIGYDATTLQQVSVFNTTPNGGLGGIWQAGGAPAVDSAGNLYLETGNGTFTADQLGGVDYGDSVLKLSTTGGLGVVDFFTPFNQQALSDADLDLGSGGVVVLPDQPGPNPHLLIGAGKEGTIYLLDRDNLGGFNPVSDQVIQSIPNALPFGVWGTPAYWTDGTTQYIYYGGTGDKLKAFTLSGGLLSTIPVSKSSATYSYPGPTPSVSANGTTNGIVWVLDNSNYFASGSAGQAILHAYDATDLATELYSSRQAGTRDDPGPAVKFTVPTVANGKVYVGAQRQLTTYGLFPAAPPPAMADHFLITGPMFNFQCWVPFMAFTNQVNTSFSITAIGPSGIPIKIKGPVYLSFRTFSGGLRPVTTLPFNNTSNVTFSYTFREDDFDIATIYVRDSAGHFSEESILPAGNVGAGIDHFVITGPSSVLVGKPFKLSIRATSLTGSPAFFFPPPPILPPIALFDTLPSGYQVKSPLLPGYAYNGQVISPLTYQYLSPSQIVVLCVAHDPGQHVFVATDGFDTGTKVITVK